MQDLSDRKSGLSEAKRALLAKRLKSEAHSARPHEGVTRSAGDGPAYPLSFAQERMWFVSQLDPDAAVYNIPVAMLIRAEVDLPTLRRAAAEVVRRHESLRTAYRAQDGDVVQVIDPPGPASVEVIDVRDQVGPDFGEGVRRLVAEEGIRPFDLTRPPLLRVTLLRVSDERYAQVVTAHHIATDGWSMPLICREIDELYAAYQAGLPSPYPADPWLRYVDYAVWQRKMLAGPAMERQVRFWAEHLEGAEQRDLPTDRPRPPHQSYRGRTHRFNIGPRVTNRLREICAEETATLNMVLLAAFAAVLRRWAGGDVVIGSLFGNRSRAELEQVCGYFVNTLPLRVDLADDPPFREAIRRAKRVILEGDAHQDVPFEKLVEQLGHGRDPSRNPLFQVMYFHHVFVHTHHAGQGGMTGSLDAQPIYTENAVSLVDTGTAMFDLDLATLESGEGLMAVMNYATDLFDAGTPERLARHFVALLESAGRAPDARVSALASLPADEARQLAEWSALPSPIAPAEPLHRRFERQAAAHPDAVAVVSVDGSLTYAQLDARASALARGLREAGAGPERTVAVLLEHSPEAAVAILGVLKAGAAYLPIDPSYPPERLRWLLDDANPAAIVADARGRDALGRERGESPSLPRGSAEGPARGVREGDSPVIAIDTIAAFAAEPGIDLDPQSAAYVLYTSGSTGIPKGVVVSHAAASIHLASSAEAYGLTADDRVLAFAALTFDPSIEQLLGPLLAGASMVMRGPELWSTAQLAERVGEMGITVVDLPTAYWSELVHDAAAMAAVKRAARLLIVGGEAMLPEPARRSMDASGAARLLNGYGPTEGVVTSTAFELPAGWDDGGRGRVPIGRPLGGRVVRVLGEGMQPAGIGVPGELCLGGPALARGYLGRAGETASRFVPDPFADEPGARLYRTGDRVRWRDDGALEFIGRVDDQVKVRGFRVEPGEVEAALAAHPSVRRAAAAARDDDGHRRLVAWVAADGVDGAALRAYLAARLPEHLVPAAVVVLPELPLTPTGKVDRRALPAPDLAAGSASSGTVMPRNRVEEVLARIWADLLGHEVGVHDDFFEVGGDSIISIRVIARASQEGVRITPRHVFERHTIAELAEVAGTAAAVEAEQGPVVGTAPLTPIQHWFFERGFDRPERWNMSMMFELGDRTAPDAVRRAWDAVLAHHDALRTRFPVVDGERVQDFAAPAPADLPVIDLSTVADDALSAAIEAEADRAQDTLDLADGPAARAVLIDCGPARAQRLLAVVHHLLIDAVSWTVLGEDLETALRQANGGESIALPPKTTSVLDWSRRLADHARSPEATAEAAAWLALPASPALPLDDPNADDVEAETRGSRVELSDEETRALLQEVPAAYGTRVNDALLAAFARAYGAWSGQPSMVVELEGHGREDLFEGVDLSRTVGWFTSQYPVALDAVPGADPGASLRAAKERLRAIARNGIGYGLLRHLAGGDVSARLAARDEGGIAFNYLGQQDAHASADGAAGGLLRPARESAGANQSPRARRPQRLAVEAMVADGRLHVGLYHGPSIADASARRLADEYARALRELIEHCRAPDAGGFTPSDFPEAGLDQAALDALMARLGGD